jgi:hypothetical protein
VTVYALHLPDGRFAYHLPTPKDFPRDVTGVYADGQPMEKLPAGWWASPSEAARLTIVGQPTPVTVGYTLDDKDTQSVRYPATLTVAEYQERRDDEDNLWQFYTAVREDQPAVEHVYDGLVMVLEGREPPTPDELPWQADLPHVLGSRPEYLHLFPGRIPGFRDHVQAAIKKMLGVQYCFDNYENYKGLHVTVRVPFEQPQTRWQADLSRRTSKPLKTGRNVPELVSRTLRLPVPASISAANYEMAVDDWHEQVEFWLSIVRSASVAACNTCNGTGHVNHGSEQYSR